MEIMGKKSYVKPILLVECFTPNEYCYQVCISLACSIPQAESDTQTWGDSSGAQHSKRTNKTGCGWADNQVIRIDDSGNVTIVEKNYAPDGSGSTTETLCNVTVPNGKKNVNNMTLPLNVEWNTTTDMTYYHKGTITSIDNSQKGSNHS